MPISTSPTPTRRSRSRSCSRPGVPSRSASSTRTSSASSRGTVAGGRSARRGRRARSSTAWWSASQALLRPFSTSFGVLTTPGVKNAAAAAGQLGRHRRAGDGTGGPARRSGPSARSAGPRGSCRPRRAVAEADVAVAPARVAELLEPAMLLGDDEGGVGGRAVDRVTRSHSASAPAAAPCRSPEAARCSATFVLGSGEQLVDQRRRVPDRSAQTGAAALGVRGRCPGGRPSRRPAPGRWPGRRTVAVEDPHLGDVARVVAERDRLADVGRQRRSM